MSQQLKSLSEILQNILPDISVATKNYYDFLYDISTTIFEKRIKMDMTQKKFAEYLGVTQAMVSKYESGDYNFTIETLCKLAEKMDMTPQVSLNPYHNTPTFDFINKDATSTLTGTELTAGAA